MATIDRVALSASPNIIFFTIFTEFALKNDYQGGIASALNLFMQNNQIHAIGIARRQRFEVEIHKNLYVVGSHHFMPP